MRSPRFFEFLEFKKRRSRIFGNVRFPKPLLHCCLLSGGNSNKKARHQDKRQPRRLPVIPTPGNLVTHRQRLRTRGSVQSAPLFCCIVFRFLTFMDQAIRYGVERLFTRRWLKSTDMTRRHPGHFISMTPEVGVILSKIRQPQIGHFFMILISYLLLFIRLHPPPFLCAPTHTDPRSRSYLSSPIVPDESTKRSLRHPCIGPFRRSVYNRQRQKPG